MGRVQHLLRAAKVLARDPGVPRWLRWLFVFGLLPIPLFFDELALVLATGIMLVFHRRRVMQAWVSTQESDSAVTKERRGFSEGVEHKHEPGEGISPPPAQRGV
jgi:hypothetical protein